MFAGSNKKGEVVGFIGKGMYVEGRLVFEDTVRIEGSFKGDIESTGDLIVGEGGYVEGNIKVGTALVTGEVRGVLEAAGRVEFRAPGKIFGEIRTPSLMIGEGVIFEGNCVMKKKDGRPAEVLEYKAG